MFVEHDDQQGASPVGTIANGIVNRGDESLSSMEVRRAVEFVRIALRMRIVFRTPDERIEIDRLGEGQGGEAALFRGRSDEVFEVGEVLGQGILPHLFLSE